MCILADDPKIRTLETKALTHAVKALSILVDPVLSDEQKFERVFDQSGRLWRAYERARDRGVDEKRLEPAFKASLLIDDWREAKRAAL